MRSSDSLGDGLAEPARGLTPQAGFEPATSALGKPRSIQLSYWGSEVFVEKPRSQFTSCTHFVHGPNSSGGGVWPHSLSKRSDFLVCYRNRDYGIPSIAVLVGFGQGLLSRCITVFFEVFRSPFNSGFRLFAVGVEGMYEVQ